MSRVDWYLVGLISGVVAATAVFAVGVYVGNVLFLGSVT